ncbi:MAG: hypothetical protein ACD_84C00011G0001, partial [uncultured bacterium]
MANNAEVLRQYPRGFLGTNVDSAGIDTANVAVETLYAQYIKNNIATCTPEFRHSILKVALNAFGTKDFSDWFLTQPKSPSYGDMHERFLIDTLRFIETGRRDLSLESWSILLKKTTERVSSKLNVKITRDFFGIYNDLASLSKAERNVQLTDVIQNWCSQPGGL